MRTVTWTRNLCGPQGTHPVRARFLGSMSSREPLVYELEIESEITDLLADFSPAR